LRRWGDAALSRARDIIASHPPGVDETSLPTVERLIDAVLDAIPDAEHARKWGQLTFTRSGDWHHWICAISPTEAAVKLVIHKGALLADPDGLMTGDGRYLRAIRFQAPDEVNAQVVGAILQEAAARQTEAWPGDSA
jgi:hypothetical protein